MRPETASVHSVAKRIAKADARMLPALLTDARLYLDDACKQLALRVVGVRVKADRKATGTAIASALVEFALYPDVETARACYRVITAHHAAVLRASDAVNVRLLADGVHAPETPAPLVHRAPCGSLDWQTHPVIGIDPSVWAEGLELATAIDKRAKRIQGSPRRERPVVAPLRSLTRGKYALKPAEGSAEAARRRKAVAAAVVALAERWGSR